MKQSSYSIPILAGSRDRYESDRYRDGPRRDNDRYDGGRDRYRDRYDDRDRRDFDRGGVLFCFCSNLVIHFHFHLLPVFSPDVLLGYDSRGGGGGGAGGGGRRAFGSGFRRDYDDNRSSSDRYGERDRYGDREDRYERRDERREERGESLLIA